MLEFLQYSFMIRAMVAGIVVAVMLPVLGSFLVARRYSLMADSLAHVSLAGIGLGLLVGSSPVVMAIPVAVAGGMVLEYLRQSGRLSGENGLAVLMSGGLATAVVLAGLAKNQSVNFASYLFGSITTTSWTDIWLLGGLALVVLVVIGSWYRPLVYMAFDEDGARIMGYPVKFLNYLVVALAAVAVVLAMRVVGGLLIGALLVIPVLAASQLAQSFRSTIWWAVVLGVLAVIIGLVVAFYAGIAAGGAIVLATLTLFGLAVLLRP